jgi:hypothetical protein
VYPGEGEGWADSARKRRQLSDVAEDPLEDGQREVTDETSFLILSSLTLPIGIGGLPYRSQEYQELWKIVVT